jgi:hypothetical protein
MNLTSPEMTAMFEFWRVHKAASVAAFTTDELTRFQKNCFRTLAEGLESERYPWQFHTRGQSYADLDISGFARMHGATVVFHPHVAYQKGMEPILRGTGPKPIWRDPSPTAPFDMTDDSSLVLFFLPSPLVFQSPTPSSIESLVAYDRVKKRKAVVTIFPEAMSQIH